MNRLGRFAGIFLAWVFTPSAWAQEGAQLLVPEAFFRSVLENHPVARAAELKVQQAQATVLETRGAFDPVIKGGVDRKFFDDKNYYTLMGGSLEVPTWFGINLKAGYDVNNGTYLNSYDNLPAAGLGYVSLSVPLLQGMLMDQRRADLRTAQAMADLSLVDRQLMINDLLLRAADDYYTWAKCWADREAVAQTFEVARERVRFTAQLVALGDRPAIDTVEAGLFARQMEMDLIQAEAALNVARLKLSNHLWEANGQPIELPSTTMPMPVEPRVKSQPSFFRADMHPVVQQYEFRQRMLKFERRLKTEKFKPVLNLNYNLLTAGTNTDGIGLASLSANNYKVGVQLYFPLAVREAIGGVRKIRWKEAELEFTRTRRERETANAVAQAEFELKAALDLWGQTLDVLANQEALVKGEMERFENGESSLFLVNTRQQKLLELQLKANQIRVKWALAVAKRAWAYGRPEDWNALLIAD